MTSQNITIVNFAAEFQPIEYSHEEFSALLADADARGITVVEIIKDVATEFVARRRGIIVDFPS